MNEIAKIYTSNNGMPHKIKIKYIIIAERGNYMGAQITHLCVYVTSVRVTSHWPCVCRIAVSNTMYANDNK